MSYKRRVCIAIVFCFVLSALSIGSSLCYYIYTYEKDNMLSVGSNECQIINTFNADNLPKNITKGTVVPMKISVLNTGCTAYVRIFVAVSNDSIKDKMTIDYNERQWLNEKGSTIDGQSVWYYKESIKPNKTTEALCESITFNEDLSATERENLEIIVYAETVQKTGVDEPITDDPLAAFDSIKGGE